ncbi:MAG: hypothetical protein HY019_08780 [Aquabacterium sp.]|uniref:hypothetical protein n=1 Tax=Aquabacterium sp. TaxID=1872578 RepID=UPI0025BA2EDA|nr:hypothetical protein [Aquabacterium sp.]MBI3382085.1 hypothetical protein [Aquabacterium sp.]
MPFRPSLHHQRRFCGLLLLLWLFAVLSGTVNACVLAENAPSNQPAHHEHGGHALAHEDMEEAGHLNGHLHADDAAHHHADEHVACHKFCQDEARTLPPNKHLDGADFAPVLLLYGSPLLPEATAPPSVAHAPQRPQAHGPPLVIRLLRLTL